MKILWHSTAPYAGSGYGKQTYLFARRLGERLGHELAVSCTYGLKGSTLGWTAGIELFPSYMDFYSNDVLVDHARRHFGGDERDGLVITLLDLWVMRPEVLKQMHVAAWLPIDHDPVPPPTLEVLKGGRCVPIAMSRFGEEALKRERLRDVVYVPHGVDTAVFAPGDRADARRRMRIPEDAFLVGMVAANQSNSPSRKAFPEALEAFARFRRRHKDALLYLHTDFSSARGGVDLPFLIRQLRIPKEALCHADQYRLAVGGFPETFVARAYNAMDVLLNPAMGEGFGVPIVEAQASGCPVIVSDWTAMPELCGAGWKVGGTRCYTALQSWQLIPSVDEIEAALEEAYERRGDDELRRQAREFALPYDADLVCDRYWAPALERIAEAATRRPLAARRVRKVEGVPA